MLTSSDVQFGAELFKQFNFEGGFIMDRRKKIAFSVVIFFLVVVIASLLIGAFFLDFKLSTKDVADKSDLTIEVIRERVIKNRPEILARTSHLENSFKILCFGARKLNNVTNVEERESLVYMVNYEWNHARAVTAHIYSDITQNGFSEDERRILDDKLELRISPLSAPEKIPESVEELEEKIDFLHKILETNSASSVITLEP